MIRKASKKDIPDIVKIYEKVISSKNNLTGWLLGIYPVENTALSALEKGELFVYVDNLTGRIR